MKTTNDEILRFANWWTAAMYRSDWDEKRGKFLNIVKEFQKDHGLIKVVIVDQDKNGVVDKLENVPYHRSCCTVCCIYKGEEHNVTIK